MKRISLTTTTVMYFTCEYPTWSYCKICASQTLAPPLFSRIVCVCTQCRLFLSSRNRIILNFMCGIYKQKKILCIFQAVCRIQIIFKFPGSPGSESKSQRYRSGFRSGYSHYQAKIVRNPWYPCCDFFMTFYLWRMMKCIYKSNKETFVFILEVTE
jgi:hypothetical protein